jgi:aconitate hydratase 2/2-methylisocitrate dehydratase
MALVEEYKAHTEERAKLGVPPLPLTAEQTAELVELLKADPIVEEEYLLDLLKNHVPAGVDDAAYVKAAFLNAVVTGDAHCKALTPVDAIKILGSMLGGFNVGPLVEALKSNHVEVAQAAADELKNTILVYDAFNTVKDLWMRATALPKR